MGFPQTNMGEQPRKTSRELFDRFCNQVSSVQTPVDRSLDSGYTIDKGLFLVVRKIYQTNGDIVDKRWLVDDDGG